MVLVGYNTVPGNIPYFFYIYPVVGYSVVSLIGVIPNHIAIRDASEIGNKAGQIHIQLGMVNGRTV